MIKTRQINGKYNAIDDNGSVTVTVEKHGQSARDILLIRHEDTEGDVVSVVHRLAQPRVSFNQ